jgi:magnesium-transporting ATPase (P-type)
LKKTTPFVVFVYAIASAATLLFGHPHDGFSSAIVRAVFQLIPTLLISWAIVTIVFVIVEQVQGQKIASCGPQTWDPTKLPAVRVEGLSKPRSMGQRIIELCLHCLWMAYILWVPWHPFWIIGPGVFYLDSLGVRPAPVWHVFYLLLTALLVVQLVTKLLALLPQTQRALKPLKIAADLFSAGTIGYLVWNGTYFVASDATQNLQKLATVNHSISIAFRIALFFAVLGLVSEGWKQLRCVVPKSRFAF